LFGQTNARSAGSTSSLCRGVEVSNANALRTTGTANNSHNPSVGQQWLREVRFLTASISFSESLSNFERSFEQTSTAGLVQLERKPKRTEQQYLKQLIREPGEKYHQFRAKGSALNRSV
jgi:hypothetical protein